ncbi:MAG: hypothetical protein ACKV2T_33990 [Kofleriaceae bacterium]
MARRVHDSAAMRSFAAVVLLIPTFAVAQPGTVEPVPMPHTSRATSPELLGLARGAHSAGERGDCVGARTLAARIERLDPDFHAAVISTDPSITACKPKARVYAVDPEWPVVQRPTRTAVSNPSAVTYPRDRGRNGIGQLFLGSVMGAGVGLLGGLFGASTSEDELGGVLLFGSLGLVTGTTAGVIFAGDNEATDYSLGWTIAGSVSGTLLGWRIVFSNNNFENAAFAVGVLVVTPTLGAMLGFNVSRRQLYPDASLRVSIPSAPRISDPTTTMPVLSGSF